MPEVDISGADKSTNGRSHAVSLSRGAMAALASISPHIASHVVERIFFRPPRAKPSPRAVASLATGERRTLELDGLPLRYWVWPGEGPSVYLLHGWGGAATQLTSFVPQLRARVFSVVAIDAPAHGESGGARSTLLHFSRALRAIAGREGAPHAVVAHSLGGAATAHAIREGLPVGRAVFIGTPADIGVYFRDFLAAIGVPRRRHDAIVAALEERFRFSWEELGLQNIGPAMTTPLLVVHDHGDEEIPWKDGALIARSWPGAVLVSTSGLGHRRILRDPEVIAHVLDFVSARAGLHRERSTA
jgi:pimeloyl-ACP methyl ester carboxylesterase